MTEQTPPPLPPDRGRDAPPLAYVTPPDAHVAPAAYGWTGGAPLGYSQPTTGARRVTRPGLVTAVGVASLLFAFLGVAGSILTAVAGFVFYAGAQAMGSEAHRAKLTAAGGTRRVAPAPPARPEPEAGPNGLAGPRRRAVVEAFYAVRPIRPPRLEQLDAMLARHGRVILLTAEGRAAGAEPSPQGVRGLVADHGELFSTNPAAAPDFFRLATGRLEVYDDRAVFYPADGSATLRTSFGRPPVLRALNEAEAGAVIGRAKAIGAGGGASLNDAQAATLATVLSSPDQKLVATAGPAGAVAQSEPKAVNAAAGGAVTVVFGEGELHLGPQGQILSTQPGPPPPPRPSTAAFLTVMASSLAGMALAVVLFVAGVLLLRGLPSGRRLHFTWAWLKVVVTAAGAVAFWWMAHHFHAALSDYDVTAPARLGGGPRFMAQPWHPVAAGLAGLAYPLVVLVALRVRAVREYFHPSE